MRLFIVLPFVLDMCLSEIYPKRTPYIATNYQKAAEVIPCPRYLAVGIEMIRLDIQKSLMHI